MGKYDYIDEVFKDVHVEIKPFLAPTKQEALDESLKFAEYAKKIVPEHLQVYVFGSAIAGTAHEGSDIDVALVSDAFKGLNDDGDLDILIDALYKSDRRIEFHTFNYKQWQDKTLRLPKEILRLGVKVYDA